MIYLINFYLFIKFYLISWFVLISIPLCLFNIYYIKFFMVVLNIFITKLFLFFLYNQVVILIALVSIGNIYIWVFNNIYIEDMFDKLQKLKNFSFILSIFIFLYTYLVYILFFFKNAPLSYIYVWTVFHKEMIYSLDLILGLDSIAIFFMLLTSMVFPLIFYYINFFKKNYYSLDEYNSYIDVFSLLYIIYFFLILTFLSLNLFFFFLFFESSLMALFLLINFGGLKKKKYYASYSLFFFTIFGSVFLLAGIFILFVNFKTLNIEILMMEKIDLNLQKILSLLFFFGFAVKIPILPFYTWLPEAHVEASAIGSVLLASILLKVGSYGILRFMLPLFKEGISFFFNFFSIFCVFSILISSILALLQTDLKKIIAYSSISHMNYITLGLLTYDLTAVIGSVFYMISHAFISAGLFFIIGIIYESTGSRELVNLNNFNFFNPLLSFFFFIFNFANIAFPLTSSFVAEVLILSNFIKINIFLTFIMVGCLLISSLYTLWLLHGVLFNKLFSIQKLILLRLNEILILTFLFFMILLFGVAPATFLSNIEMTVLFYLKFNYSI